MNNNFMRPGQHKNNNNRNRNRNNNNGRRNTGGGGNSNNKVFDSNGPDIKLRGTSQTIAEKYMQLGRDAQSSGDNVAAENYYQHAEHYYRVWAASQPAGHSLVMYKKLGDEEFDEDGAEGAEDEAGDASGNPETPGNVEGAEPVEGASVDQNTQHDGQQQNRGNRNFNNRDRNNRQRWQNRRNERYEQNPNVGGSEPQSDVVADVPAAAEVISAAVVEAHDGQWEAPSFLQRPTPIQAEAAPEGEAAADTPTPRRVPRPRKPKVEAEASEAPVTEESSS
ncbi:MAG: DUF4167 domain-containing protein [Alphaproteobacteria bacterium]|nr:DUF4167 domain-containing protein [Alphaproteobacteria bacterium]